MFSGRLPAWQKVVAFAPLLLLLVSLPSEALLRCRMDGTIRSACCCPEQEEAPSSVPVVKAQDCCDREVTVNRRVPADTTRNAALDVASLALVALAEVVSPLPFAVDGTPTILRSHGPPRGGPPPTLLKHAFLI
jgi:hypothetical protein